MHRNQLAHHVRRQLVASRANKLLPELLGWASSISSSYYC
jgi:hypothetical protein